MNYILNTGLISGTMLNAASNFVTGMSGPVFIIGLMFVFFLLGFVIPSSSGLAVLSMPIFAPLADTVGIPRWIIVAAYQFGQYAMLYIAPTGLIMATLQMLHMKMSDWFKFVWPMMVFTLCSVPSSCRSAPWSSTCNAHLSIPFTRFPSCARAACKTRRLPGGAVFV